MTIHDIHRKAKEHFDSLDKKDSEILLQSAQEQKDLARLDFMDKAFDLLEWVVPESELHFIEGAPDKEADKYYVVDYQNDAYYDKMQYDVDIKAWEKRRDEYEPLFKEPGTFVSHGQVHCNSGYMCNVENLDRMTLADWIDMGAELNPNHPRLKEMNWSKIIGE